VSAQRPVPAETMALSFRHPSYSLCPPVIAEAIKKFESVYALYRSDERRGIPMSVRERHEKALAEIRRQIRLAARNRGGKRLGELLLAEGVLDKGSLEQALAEQARQGSKKLLGEILVDLGFVDMKAIRRAVEEQAISEGARRRM